MGAFLTHFAPLGFEYSPWSHWDQWYCNRAGLTPLGPSEQHGCSKILMVPWPIRKHIPHAPTLLGLSNHSDLFFAEFSTARKQAEKISPEYHERTVSTYAPPPEVLSSLLFHIISSSTPFGLEILQLNPPPFGLKLTLINKSITNGLTISLITKFFYSLILISWFLQFPWCLNVVVVLYVVLKDILIVCNIFYRVNYYYITVKTHVYIPLSLCIQLTDHPDGHEGYQYFCPTFPQVLCFRVGGRSWGPSRECPGPLPLVVLSHLFGGRSWALVSGSV